MASFEIVKCGGVTTPSGFRATGVHAGFRKNPNRFDFALVVADALARTTGVFTQNRFCAAPVTYCREVLDCSGCQGCGVKPVKVIAINSGNANAATGDAGLKVAGKSAKIVANALGCDIDEVLVASTGVIGVPLPIEPFYEGTNCAVQRLSQNGGRDAAKAIMTTDTKHKEVAVKIDGKALGLAGDFYIGGMVKGSGMIQPDMATMIAVITTDVPLTDAAIKLSFKRAVDKSFNCVTVDSDTSTNDSAFFMCSAKDGDNCVDVDTPAFVEFSSALNAVCIELAKKIAQDGEGASRAVQVTVTGARDDAQANAAAREVANSPLVKTAIAGHDANWGRVAAALGKSTAEFDQYDVDIDFLDIPVLRGGLPVEFDEEEALNRFNNSEVNIDCKLGAGEGSAVIWTCDLTHDYISINADYRS